MSFACYSANGQLTASWPFSFERPCGKPPISTPLHAWKFAISRWGMRYTQRTCKRRVRLVPSKARHAMLDRDGDARTNERAVLVTQTPRGTSTGDPARPTRPLADSESALMSDRRLAVRALSVLLLAAVAGSTGDLAAQESSSRSGAAAAALSLGAPGLAIGSYYVGEPGHAVVFTGGVAVSVLVAVYESQHVSVHNGQHVSQLRRPRRLQFGSAIVDSGDLRRTPRDWLLDRLGILRRGRCAALQQHGALAASVARHDRADGDTSRRSTRGSRRRDLVSVLMVSSAILVPSTKPR